MQTDKLTKNATLLYLDFRSKSFVSYDMSLERK